MVLFALLAALVAILLTFRYFRGNKQGRLPGYIGDKRDVLSELRKAAMLRLGAWDVFDALARTYGEGFRSFFSTSIFSSLSSDSQVRCVLSIWVRPLY